MTRKPGDLFAGAFAIFCVLAFFWLIGDGIWSSAIKPTLGYFGVIEYKTKTEERYDSFLKQTVNCEEKKKVYSEKSAKYPVFQLFECPDGNELIWKYKIEVVQKVDPSKWLLE